MQYVDKAVVHQAGYQSHKEMKKSMFIRAKVSFPGYFSKEGSLPLSRSLLTPLDRGPMSPCLRPVWPGLTRAMFHYVKCVYDNGSEKDRISIIQSVSLLAFWYSDLGERTESWHWMGIAISLSQTLGLNRDPDRGQYNTRLSERQRQLWRRIWWSEYFLLCLMILPLLAARTVAKQ